MSLFHKNYLTMSMGLIYDSSHRGFTYYDVYMSWGFLFMSMISDDYWHTIGNIDYATE